MKRIKILAGGSIAVGLIVLALKYVAYHLTGSVALLSDAIESIVNVATAVAALIAISFAAQPADANHPYGHHKAEYISAVIEGVLIVIAAIFILREAWLAYQSPRLIDAPWLGLAVNGVASVINAIWCTILIKQGRAAQIARARRGWPASVHRRHIVGWCLRRRRPRRSYRAFHPRSAARRIRRAEHPVVGLASDEGIRRRIARRGIAGKRSVTHPRGHSRQCRWCARSA